MGLLKETPFQRIVDIEISSAKNQRSGPPRFGHQEKPAGTILVFLPGWGDIALAPNEMGLEFVKRAGKHKLILDLRSSMITKAGIFQLEFPLL